MTLDELIERHGKNAAQGVPDWMLGFWKRRWIGFADGLTDSRTHVCWVQSRNFSIDLRLPLEADMVTAKALGDYTHDELLRLADHEGWCADSVWDGQALHWLDTEASLQLHNRWPEPAFLKRTGNCMIEHCPSNAYVEDWRLQSSGDGPLVGLRLIEERDAASGAVRRQGGGLIVCGAHAALVLGRSGPLHSGKTLKALVGEAGGDLGRLHHLFNVETSVARHSDDGYTVFLSTQPARMGQSIFPLDGFAFADGLVTQRLESGGVAVERVFSIDTLERSVSFAQTTAFTPEAAAWRAKEQATLGRYVEKCL